MKHILLLLITSLFSSNINCQNNEKLEEIASNLKELKEKILEENNVEFGKIDFILNDRTTGRYQSITIDKIELKVVDGCFYGVKVFINGDVYLNPSAPIAVTNRRLNKSVDYLFYSDSNKTKKDSIKFQLLIKENSNFKPYCPQNIDKVIIDKENLSYTLKKDLSLNSLLDVRFMSDALALFSDEANGIVQTEVKSKFILFRGNWANTGLFFANYLNIKANYTKLDSAFKTINLLEYNSAEILQKSIFSAEIALNAVRCNFFNFKSPHKFYTDAGFSFSSNEIQNDDIKSTINSYCFFIETGINLKLYDELDLNINNRFIRLMSPETKEYNGSLTENFINFNRMTFDLEYHLNKPKTKKLFLRLNYFRPINSLSVSDNQFTQIQIGYSKLFTDLF